MKKIKVLHLLSSLNIGGREKVAIDIVNNLDREKFLPFLMSLRPKGTMQKKVKEDVKIITYNKSDKLDFGAYRRISNVLKENQIDILHTHNPGGFLYGFIGGKLAGVKTIVNTEHGFEYNINFKKRLAESFCRRFTTLTIAVSEDVKKRLGASGMIRVLHNGIIIDEKDYSSEKEKIRRSIGVMEDEVLIGCVARLAYVKNHRCLFRAFKIASDINPKLKLLIVGDGYLKENLLSLREELSLRNKIIFYGETDNVSKVLNALDIFALTSVYEGISITILEAMACGLPVVATKVGGNPDVIEDGKSGILAENGNEKEIAEAFLVLAKNKELRINFGCTGRKIVYERFNFKNTLQEIENIYLNSFK
ncbi:MAG: glycosyltransferase [Candidatus Schekmanbacteria bacterium]|nr:MAG: glycosyltransferase [Candidatus Schekmanbacteria bacterium]